MISRSPNVENKVSLTRQIKPIKDARTGFIVAGKNDTESVRKLTEMNGRKIADRC